MGIFDHGKSRLAGAGRAFAYLTDVRRLGTPLKIEDSRGQEISGVIDLIADDQIRLTLNSTVELDPGLETNLVFILYGFRFKARTSVLEARHGMIVVNLPSAISMAERRRVPRGFLNFALAGLFSPLAASGSASMETTQAFAYEAGVQSASMGGYPYDPGTTAKPAERGQSVPLKFNLASDSPWAAIHVNQWLKGRNLSLNDPLSFRQPTTLTGQNPFVKKIHGGSLTTRGVTYTFLSCGLPTGWRGNLHANRAKFELFFNRGHVYLGIRVK